MKGAKGGQAGRLAWLDAAKGLGIILVVVAHIWTRGTVRDDIYAFHMPLFFLIGGYVAHPRPMVAFMRTQWRSMAIPYIAFLLSLAVLDQIIEHARGHLPIFRNWGAAAWGLLLGGSELRGPFTIFWFIPCLIFARIAQNALMLRWPDPRDWRWAATMAVVLVFGVWIGAQTDFSPLGLLSVPVALVFLWLGALWRTIGGGRWFMTLAALASVIILLCGPLAPLGMKIGDYGVPGWSLGGALVLSLGLCALAQAVPLWPFLHLGRMSLVIMYLHVAVVHYCAPYFGKIPLLPLAIGIPVVVFLLLSGTVFGRRYFLGKAVEGSPKPL
tara:strand:+ start:33983 stop:34963 length:981 start_codon:yes stop_codon:yes gene_type:complete